MLEELHISEFALIDDALIDFRAGLNVLTGETGAGKTILLAALGLLLGDRADTTTIRAGSDEARVEGRFSRNDHDELVISRIISAQGKSKCYVDGSLVSVATLARLGDRLVDLHGQHEHQALLSAASHVEYLDRFCGAEQLARRARWTELLERLRDLQQRITELTRFGREREERRDLLGFQLREIDGAELEPREDEQLAARLEVLRHAERLASAAGVSHVLLSTDDDDSGALDGVRAAVAAVSGMSGVDERLDELRARLESSSLELEELSRELRNYSEGVECDAAALAESEARMALIGDLKRKYGDTIEEILDFSERVRADLEKLESIGGNLADLDAAHGGVEAELASLGGELHVARVRAASRFQERMAAELEALNMAKAQFVAAIRERPPTNGDSHGPTGPDDVEFLFSASVGESPRPLTKIASGGEISRVMLAAKVVLGAADDVSTLVFDEIDAGVGGKTAAAVGAKLSALAKEHQVICVTHLPQIASLADRHLSVAKVQDGGRTVTSVTVLDGEDRVAEVARMLSGAKVSETSLRHAREMLGGSA